MIRAYCYPSGVIVFARRNPGRARIIARGPDKALRDFISGKARLARLHPRHREQLLVPGIPEADSEIAARLAFERWTKWIAVTAPRGVRVLQPANPGAMA